MTNELRKYEDYFYNEKEKCCLGCNVNLEIELNEEEKKEIYECPHYKHCHVDCYSNVGIFKNIRHHNFICLYCILNGESYERPRQEMSFDDYVFTLRQPFDCGYMDGLVYEEPYINGDNFRAFQYTGEQYLDGFEKAQQLQKEKNKCKHLESENQKLQDKVKHLKHLLLQTQTNVAQNLDNILEMFDFK